MANQSSKKDKKSSIQIGKYLMITIISVTIIHLLIFIYSMIFKGYELRRGDYIGFIVLSSLNYILYNLIITLRNAFYINYIYDLLIINLAIMLLVNFHWKFWFLYLILPGYGVIKLGMYLFEYTKTIGQADPNEVAAPQGLNSKKREKIKVEKIKH